MKQADRAETLEKVASRLGKEAARQRRAGSPPVANPDALAGMSWDEIGFVVEGLALGQRPIGAAAREVTRRYNLGPRGAYILSLISGGVVFPLELATALKAGRSLITAELARLTEAGLITATPGKDDRRRSELALTDAGAAVCMEVRAAMRRIITRNLSAYSPEEIRLLGRMLHDVRQLDTTESEDC